MREAPIDPTKNVLDLVAAESKRQDDLRNAEANHRSELERLRAYYDAQLRAGETARLDARHAADATAVIRAAEATAVQATALAQQVNAAAEAMRSTVAATAQALAQGQTAALDPIQKDIALLRQAMYESAGQRTQSVETRARSGNTGLWVGVGIAVFGVILSTLAIAVTIVLAILLTP